MGCKRVLIRLLKFTLPVALVVLFLNGTIIVSFVQRQFLTFKARRELVPYNQLNRLHFSRERLLCQVQKFIYIHWAQQAKGKDLDKFCASFKNESVCTSVSYEIKTLRAMGLPITDSNVSLLGNKSYYFDFSKTRSYGSEINIKYITNILCYNQSRSRKTEQRTVDVNFCPKLLQLFQGIRNQTEPFLLVLFTWWPDPLYDADKLTRKLVLENCKRLRPFVETVIFTDSRMIMAGANVMNFSCLPVPEYNSDGVPVFRSMANVVMRQFKATFYGYLKASTVFDASFLETLLAIKEIHFRQNKSGANLKTAPTPISMYGEALYYPKLSSAADLQVINTVANSEGTYEWKNPESRFVYLIFTMQDMADLPALIIDDDDLVPFMTSRSSALGHVIIDVGRTVTAVHVTRKVTHSEWNRKYMSLKPRDVTYNKRLMAESYATRNTSRPSEWKALFTMFNKNGKVVLKGSH